MDDTEDLRVQARQWRRLAQRYSPGLAQALIAAAKTLDAQADGIDAKRHPRTAQPDTCGQPGD
jgi:hypothetical protein